MGSREAWTDSGGDVRVPATPAAGPGLAEVPPTAETVDDSSSSGLKQPGVVVGSYRIIGLLGEGGMGRVYAAEHKLLGRKVALKMLRSEYARNAAAVSRFFAEARAVNQIAHENIIVITDFVEATGDEGDNFYVMELLEGVALKDLMAEGVIPLSRSIGIALQVASALRAVHGAGIIHRDLKPANVFLTTRGGRPDFVKLLDFGVAKLAAGQRKDLTSTATGAIVGTPQYMSPEQLNGEPVDHSCDIYAFGLILYELVSGQRAFEGKGLGDLAVKHLTARPKPPSKIKGLPHRIPKDLEDLILHCLGKKPAERPASMAVVEERLLAVATAEGIPVERAWDAPASGVHRPPGSKAPVVAALAVAAGLSLTLVAAALLAGDPAAEAAPAPPPTAPTPQPTTPAAPTAPPPPPVEVMVQVHSTPPGASVRRGPGGPLLGVTPLSASLPRAASPVELVLELSGYLPVTETIRPDSDVRVEVRLAPVPKKPRRKVRQTDVVNPYE